MKAAFDKISDSDGFFALLVFTVGFTAGFVMALMSFFGARF